MNKEEQEEYFRENHKTLWVLTLYDTNINLFFEFVKEKNYPEEQIKEMIRLSKEFKKYILQNFRNYQKNK